MQVDESTRPQTIRHIAFRCLYLPAWHPRSQDVTDTLVYRRVAAGAGIEPTVIAQLSSGWAVIDDPRIISRLLFYRACRNSCGTLYIPQPGHALQAADFGRNARI